jgi:hypothetical protein
MPKPLFDNVGPGDTAVLVSISIEGATNATFHLPNEKILQSLCLDVPAGQVVVGHQLQIWDCNGTGSQRFRFDAKTIRFGNLCLATAPETYVEKTFQQRKKRTDGRPGTEVVPGGKSSTGLVPIRSNKVILADCGSEQTGYHLDMRYQIEGWPTVGPRIVGPFGNCIGVEEYRSGAPVILHACNGGSNWWYAKNLTPPSSPVPPSSAAPTSPVVPPRSGPAGAPPPSGPAAGIAESIGAGTGCFPGGSGINKTLYSYRDQQLEVTLRHDVNGTARDTQVMRLNPRASRVLGCKSVDGGQFGAGYSQDWLILSVK